MEPSRKKVVVVGSGVYGLSIALQLKTQGDYQVTILARELASDIDSHKFASPWAGANWASTTTDKKQQVRDEVTFKQMIQWTKKLPKEIITEMPFIEYFYPQSHKAQVDQWRSSFLPEYRTNTIKSKGEELIAVEHQGITLNAPAFLANLEKELKSNQPSNLFSKLDDDGTPISSSTNADLQPPVKIIRADLQRLSDAFEYVPDAQLIINATGLGSFSLQDVLDKSVYPIRGQTVLIKASRKMQEQTYCAMSSPPNSNLNAHHSLPQDQEVTYVIPRAKSGNIICGGCAVPHDWTTEIDSALSERILQRCVELVPELLDDGVDPTSKEAWKTLTILDHGVGLRPSRKEGTRIELERISTSDNHPKAYHVLHAYGAGSGGYQSGYGSTVEAFKLIASFFKSSSTLEQN